MAIPTNTQIYGKVVQRYPKNIINLRLEKETGLSYPIQELPLRGYFTKSTGLDLLRSNLSQMIRTEPGERFMLPDYGCGLKKYLMEPLDQVLFDEIKNSVYESINKYFEKVSISKLQVFETGDNSIKVELFCQLRTESIVKFNFSVEIQ